MFKLNKRGVIGFMLTMAVGAALGAAALVVTSEISRDDKDKKIIAPVAPVFNSNEAVEKAFQDYQTAYSEYQKAVGMGRKDMDRFARAFNVARKKLELELLKNTPGVSEMDLTEITNPGSVASPGNLLDSPSGKGSP